MIHTLAALAKRAFSQPPKPTASPSATPSTPIAAAAAAAGMSEATTNALASWMGSAFDIAHGYADRAMHRPADHPYCFTPFTGVTVTEIVAEALTLPAAEPVSWAYDQGRSCGNACDDDQWKRTLAHTPGCAGCIRALRGLLLQGRQAPQPQAAE